jgi:GT2 family glycosyltransferase
MSHRIQSFGIVILNWNNYDATQRCITSLRMENIKIYLADNGSTDGSKEKLWQLYEGNELIQLIDNKKNLGFAAGCNRPLEMAYIEGHDFLVLLNNDCIIEDQSIFEKVEKRFSSEQDIGIVGGKIMFWPETNKVWSTGGYISYLGAEIHIGHGQFDNESLNGHFERQFISGAFMCIRREVIERIGLLPDAYFFGKEEWEFSTVAIRNKFKLVYDSNAVVFHEASSSHEWTDPFYIYNGNLSKILYKRRNYSAPEFLLWFAMYVTYVFIFLGARYERNKSKFVQGVSPKVIRWSTIQAIRDSLFMKKIEEEHIVNFKRKYAALQK